MKYDFKTVVDRSQAGSGKWDGMRSTAGKFGVERLPAGIIPLSVADMELKNPPELVEGLCEFLRGTVLGYSSLTDSYYEAVLSWMERRHDWRVEKEWIVTSAGVVPAVYNSVKAYTEPGDGVIMMTPVYYPFYSAAEGSGRTAVHCPLIERGGRYTVDYAAFEELCAEKKNKLFVLCSPHNPVGRVWSREELSAMGEICLRHGVTIVSDEIHFDLIMPGHTHTVLASISPELADITVTCTAPSKTFNLAGMQASNIIISNKELRERYIETVGRSGLNITGAKACELAYTRCEGWLDSLLLHLDENRRLCEDFIAGHMPQIKVTPLEGTYLQWWDCRALGMDPEELERFMVTRALVFSDEGKLFGEEGNGFERINIACPSASLRAALERLAAAAAVR